MRQTLGVIDDWIENRNPNYICVRDVHGIVRCRKDPNLRRIHAGAGLVVPDGMPLVWLSRMAGHSQVDRVYGPDLMYAVVAEGLGKGWRHFFYGGRPGITERLTNRLAQCYPGLQVAGTICPPFRAVTEKEDRAAIKTINDSGTDIVWVGLSTPKQERWMAAHCGKLDAPVFVGVGAAFDFNSGSKMQAPRWLQRSGFEWLFRMLTEPRRLGPRYLKSNPQFFWFLLQQLLFHHKDTKATRH
jgi:N-acetylglucosaminyldiphosphoundecaprenol N-acetyl-beta-D-mannosaminyltransferase